MTKECPAPQSEAITLLLTSFSTHLSFRWTLPSTVRKKIIFVSGMKQWRPLNRKWLNMFLKNGFNVLKVEYKTCQRKKNSLKFQYFFLTVSWGRRFQFPLSFCPHQPRNRKWRWLQLHQLPELLTISYRRTGLYCTLRSLQWYYILQTHTDAIVTCLYLFRLHVPAVVTYL